MAEKTETIVESKFIFTNEGRCSLTSQDGGIRFAVLGAVLVQGLEPVKLEDDDKVPNPLDGDGRSTSPFYNKYRTITLDDLTPEKGVRLGLKEIKYRAIGNERIEPENIDDYMDALHHIENYLLPLKYRHAGEVKDKFGNVYGEYQFDCDRTTLNWDPDSGNDISFAHICLIGKQYSETNDAAFNVNQTQKPVVVGIAQIAGSVSEDGNVFTGGIQMLADQNDYVDILLKLRFTLDENDYDIGTTLDLDEDANEVLEISKKFSLINNGLKTDSTKGVKMSIVSNKDTIVDLNLDNDGTIATSRTLMVADAYDAHELENQWNAAGLIHIINRQDDDNRYKEQLILSTIERYEDLTDELTAYNAGMMLKGSNPEIITAGFNNPFIPVPSDADPSARNLTAEGPQPPMFTLNAVPNYDKYVAEFFGEENTYLGSKNIDKTIFSKYNITFNPNSVIEGGMDDWDGNILINSNYNYITNANADNTLINSDYNVLSANAFTNMLIGADANIIRNNAAGNTIIASNMGIFEGPSTTGNIVLGGVNNRLNNSKDMRLFGIEGLLADGKAGGVIFGKWNKDEAAGIIYGNGTDDSHRFNALAFYPRDSRLSLFTEGKQMDISPAGLTFPEGATLAVDNIKTKTVNFGQWEFKNLERGGFGLNVTASDNTYQAITFAYPNGSAPPLVTIPGSLTVQSNIQTNGGLTAAKAIKAPEYIIGTGSYRLTTESNKVVIKNGTNTVMSVDGQGNASFNEVIVDGKDISQSTYTKVNADFYVYGPSHDNFEVGVRRYAGDMQYKSWIEALFQGASPIIYSTGNDEPSRNGCYVNYFDGNYSNHHTVRLDYNDHNEEWQTNFNAFCDAAFRMRDENGAFSVAYNRKPGDPAATGDPTIVALFSRVPPVDEIELNFFMHNYGGKNIGFIWIPVVGTSYEKIPMIKVNMILDHEKDSQDEDLHVWEAYNYTERENYPRFKNRFDISEASYITLRCTPPKVNIDAYFKTNDKMAIYAIDNNEMIADTVNPFGWWWADN